TASSARACTTGTPDPCNAPSDPPPLGLAATVVRDRGDVLDADHLDTSVLNRPDRGLPTGTRALHHHVHLPDAVAGRAFGRGFRRELRGERGALTRTLEADVARRRPRQRVALLIGERDDRVVERRLDVRHAVGDVLALFALGPASAGGRLRHCVLLRCSLL